MAPSKYYSSALLDDCGDFCPRRFLQLFQDAATCEGLSYPSYGGSSRGGLSCLYRQQQQSSPPFLPPPPPSSNYTSSPPQPLCPPVFQPSCPSTVVCPPSSGVSNPAEPSEMLTLGSLAPASAESSSHNPPLSLSPSSMAEEFEEISDEDGSDDDGCVTSKRSTVSASSATTRSPSHISASGSIPSNDVCLYQMSDVCHRLKLVLDLDNTLLHACARAKIGGCDLPLEDFISPEGDPELFRFVLPQIPNQVYYVKFRPGLRRFLQELTKICDLAVHTNATREYAEVVVALLDPDHTLFQGRVAAREDDTSRDHKKHMDRLFGTDDLDLRSLVILDDRKDVWDAMYHPNIIHCGMYDYLDSRRSALIAKYSMSANSSGDITQQRFVSKNEISERPQGIEETPFLDNPLVELSGQGADDNEECEDGDVVSPAEDTGGNELHATDNTEPATAEVHPSVEKNDASSNQYQAVAKILTAEEECLIDFDRQLDHIRELIQDVYKEYNTLKSDPSREQEANIADLLNQRRSSILAGLVVQTAGMYKSESSHPEYGWHDNGPVHRRRLVALGAQVIETIQPSLTHLLAMRATQTIDRLRRERGDEIKYVHALWLHACESTWSRVPEEWFEAMTFLKKYENSPPKKPWVDHWRVLAMHNAQLPDRLTQAVERWKSDAGNAGRSLTGSSVLALRQHIVTTALSHGAEIWTPTEHIILTFEPVKSSKLRLQLSRETSQNARRKRPRFPENNKLVPPGTDQPSCGPVGLSGPDDDCDIKRSKRRSRRGFHDRVRHWDASVRCIPPSKVRYFSKSDRRLPPLPNTSAAIVSQGMFS